MHIVLDDTAMAAATFCLAVDPPPPCGVRLVPLRPGTRAGRSRSRPAEHLAALPGITVLALDLPSALAVAQQDTWAAAHCQYAAQPTPDRL